VNFSLSVGQLSLRKIKAIIKFAGWRAASESFSLTQLFYYDRLESEVINSIEIDKELGIDFLYCY
jgi:hypothetical protein